MMETIYAMEMIDDWDLFSGQLLTASADHAADGQLQDVLQALPPRQSAVDCSPYSQSPVEEFLQDSIWLNHVDDAPDIKFTQVGKNNIQSGLDLYWPAVDNALFDEVGNDISEFASAIDSSFSIDLNERALDGKFHMADVTQTGLLHRNCGTEFKIEDCQWKLIIEQENVDQDDKNYTQNIKNSVYDIERDTESELQILGVANDLLQDPESVCHILNQLQTSSIENGVKFKFNFPTVSSQMLRDVSPDEVDSVLSHSDVMEESSSQDEASADEKFAEEIDIISGPYQHDTLKHKIRSYDFEDDPIKEVSEKKLKKKEQNKTAALRYRRKKRQEKGVVLTEVEVLEQKNSQLKTKAEDLTREISYLKGLIDEVRKQSSKSK